MKLAVAVVTMTKILFFLLIFISTQAQIPMGTWRTHPDFYATKGLEIVESKVYCFSENGLFVYDKNTKESTILSKIDGLSANAPSAINT